MHKIWLFAFLVIDSKRLATLSTKAHLEFSLPPEDTPNFDAVTKTSKNTMAIFMSTDKDLHNIMRSQCFSLEDSVSDQS